MRSPARAAWTIISVANSIPGVRSFILGYAERRSPASAVKIAQRCSVYRPREPGQHGVAQVPVKKGHGAIGDPSEKAVTDYQVEAIFELGNESCDL